jgi:hypothetical protein
MNDAHGVRAVIAVPVAAALRGHQPIVVVCAVATTRARPPKEPAAPVPLTAPDPADRSRRDDPSGGAIRRADRSAVDPRVEAPSGAHATTARPGGTGRAGPSR